MYTNVLASKCETYMLAVVLTVVDNDC